MRLVVFYLLFLLSGITASLIYLETPPNLQHSAIFPTFLRDLNSTHLPPSQWFKQTSIIIEAIGHSSLWFVNNAVLPDYTIHWWHGLSHFPVHLDLGWYFINVWKIHRGKGHTSHRRAISSSSYTSCARTEHPILCHLPLIHLVLIGVSSKTKEDTEV